MTDHIPHVLIPRDGGDVPAEEALVAAAPTPTEVAAQVEAALELMDRIGGDGWCLCVQNGAQSQVEAALRAALQVLPASPETEEWEYAVEYVGQYHRLRSEDHALAMVPRLASGAVAVRRRPGVPAGPWAPVEGASGDGRTR